MKVDGPKSLPNRPMTDEDIVEKFKVQAGKVLAKETLWEIISIVRKLEELQDINQLVALLH